MLKTVRQKPWQETQRCGLFKTQDGSAQLNTVLWANLFGMGHGVMFHHFHSDQHLVMPGSLSAERFDTLIHHLEKSFVILSPDDFRLKLERNTLAPTDIILTFDDALRCQVDVAQPVLEARSISGLFNVYSSIFEGSTDSLELYAVFRAMVFPDFPAFWRDFAAVAEESGLGGERSWGLQVPPNWLSARHYYSPEQRKFRFVRDILLSKEEYISVMAELMSRFPKFDPKSTMENVWMTSENLVGVLRGGHAVGLHSHSHPTRIQHLSYDEQFAEYSANKAWVEKEFGFEPEWVAHPCGSYSAETIEILERLGIKAGLRSTKSQGFLGSNFEIPRENHSDLARVMAI